MLLNKTLEDLTKMPVTTLNSWNDDAQKAMKKTNEFISNLPPAMKGAMVDFIQNKNNVRTEFANSLEMARKSARRLIWNAKETEVFGRPITNF